jgi:hypothetical protein
MHSWNNFLEIPQENANLLLSVNTSTFTDTKLDNISNTRWNGSSFAVRQNVHFTLNEGRIAPQIS